MKVTDSTIHTIHQCVDDSAINKPVEPVYEEVGSSQKLSTNPQPTIHTIHQLDREVTDLDSIALCYSCLDQGIDTIAQYEHEDFMYCQECYNKLSK